MSMAKRLKRKQVLADRKKAGVDMSHSTKLKDLEFMQYKLDDMADDNGWKWHGKRKTPYEIEELYGSVLDNQDYFLMELNQRMK